MYLKEIKAQGFKSFADKISIELQKGITGIVGPNGSGKSNVVDAVRWVLGEQSVKSLRGDGNMTDVIFSGSKDRKSQNVASVTLVFDNTDQYLPISFREVALKRRVYKDGSNEYFMNNEKCRLKDIIDLLLDSGIAKESFNIISQGKIDEILLSKPIERRTIFEEAASVLKYKRRKEDAFRKLERTHDNMNRVEDIIKELEDRVEPLKKQREKALLYEKKYEDLKTIDLSLLVYDISTIYNIYEKNKKKIEELNEEILSLNASTNKGEAKISDFKNKIALFSSKINETQKKLLELTSTVEKMNSQKQILLERKKYEVEDQKLHTALVSLKEDSLKIQNQITSLSLETETLKREKEEIKEKLNINEKEYEKVKKQKEKLDILLTSKIRIRETLTTKIEARRESIESLSSLPYAVKSVLENNTLQGIHNIIGSLFEVEEKYSTAISTSLGYMATNIVVEDENAAKEAIIYLKKKDLGRATFFPISVIKPKKIDISTQKVLENIDGYIGVASSLVKFERKYQNIIENQLGNVIVAKNMEAALKIANQTSHHYKIVTLDGELIHTGGSMTGGRQKKESIIESKFILEREWKEKENTIKEIGEIEDAINEVDAEIKKVEDKLYLINKSYIEKEEKAKNKESQIHVLTSSLEKIQNELEGTKHILEKTLHKEEEEIIEKFYETEKEKVKIENELKNLIHEKEDLEENLEIYELERKKENSLFNQKNKELTNLEIEVNRSDVKLDNLLNYLTEEYNMTYDNAQLKYKLSIDEKEARQKLSLLKREIKEIGPVNIEAIEEYEKVAERYEFLMSQRDDLIEAENTLLDIIKEMDEVMIHDFEETFHIISKNFEETFRELFKGGYARLILTDPENILETGVEIEASPPGKSLKSISLLSGGEKTFTAISLLFAILKSRPVPFCILDEVEAALDEANVNSFGEYLQTLKEKTQFILITHKKKTMEFADVLYGITMQESGVSKLVSVRLEDLNKKKADA